MEYLCRNVNRGLSFNKYTLIEYFLKESVCSGFGTQMKRFLFVTHRFWFIVPNCKLQKINKKKIVKLNHFISQTKFFGLDFCLLKRKGGKCRITQQNDIKTSKVQHENFIKLIYFSFHLISRVFWPSSSGKGS